MNQVSNPEKSQNSANAQDIFKCSKVRQISNQDTWGALASAPLA
jgi:hypothetical protein